MKAAKVDVEAYWPNLFAKLAEKKNLDDLILNAAGGGAPASVSAPVAAASATAVAAPTEEKKVGFFFGEQIVVVLELCLVDVGCLIDIFGCNTGRTKGRK